MKQSSRYQIALTVVEKIFGPRHFRKVSTGHDSIVELLPGDSVTKVFRVRIVGRECHITIGDYQNEYTSVVMKVLLNESMQVPAELLF